MSIIHHVYARHLSGHTAEEIAIEFGITIGRVKYIILQVGLELEGVYE